MKKLIIIGASYLQLPLILKAKEMGLETHVFAWEEGSVGKEYSDFFYPISIIEKEKILEITKQIKPAGIISIASDLAMYTVNYVASEMDLIGNSIFCTEVTTNKYAMRNQLEKCNLPCPNYNRINDIEDINLPDFQFPIIIKPTDRSGSRGITKINHKSELNYAVNVAYKHSFRKEIIIEEFIEGDEISIETISWQGKHYFLTGTDKETTGQPHFVETSQHQPSKYLNNLLKKKIIEITYNCLSALQVENGASHTELKITPNGDIYVIEVGARMGGDFIGSDLVQLSTGYDFVRAVIEIALGIFVEPEKTEENYSGVYFVCPQKQGKVKSILDNTGDYKNEIVKKEIQTKVGDYVKPITQSADRKGYYIYKSNQKLLEKNLIRLVIE